MKIAMLGHKRIPSREGGIEIVVEKLATAFAKAGHDVTVYNRRGHHVSGAQFNAGSSRKEYKGVKLKNVFTFKGSALNAIVYSALASLKVCFSDCEVVHYHAEGPASMCFLPKLFKKRVIVTIHGLDWQRAKWGGFATKFLLFGERTAVKYADEIIVLSKNVQEYFLEKYARKTVFIPNGADRGEYVGDEILRNKYAISRDSYILYLGRLVPEKRCELLIKAYMNTDTDKKLVIAGGASHTGEYEAELHELAKNDGRIVFTGFVEGETLSALYSNAYIYCLPSDIEGMPLSLLEAMSYSNCCLTSDIAECTEVCKDRAVYFRKNDLSSLEEKLTLLLNDGALVRGYKDAAADYITGKYNWDDIAEKTLALYRGEK